MPKVNINLATGYYESSSLPLAAQECVNWYPQNPQTEGALSPVALFYTPGIDLALTLPEGPYRCDDLFDDEVYVISGSRLYRIDIDLTFEDLGGINGTGRCSMTNNGTTIAIQVPGGDGYFYDKTNGLQLITDPDYQTFQSQEGGVQAVAFKDGYFVYTTAFEFFLSSLVTENGGRNFDGLQFGTAEVKPDKNVRPANIKNELYILGTDTIELFQNTGSSGQPFQRIQTATLDKGIVGQHAFVEQDNSYVFLGGGVGEGVSVWRGGPGAAQKISTAAIDLLINQYTISELQDAFISSYNEEGNFFVMITVADTTIVYDSTSSTIQGRPIWSRRSTDGGSWRVAAVSDVYGKNVVFDTVDGRVGLMSRTRVTEYGETVKRQASGVYFANQGAPFTISQLEVRNETGVGNEDSPDPQMQLEMSIDGGRTWLDLGKRSLGGELEYDKRQIWYRLGQARYQTVFRITVEEPVRSNVLQAVAEIEGGF